jgi:hypothetical protein
MRSVVSVLGAGIFSLSVIGVGVIRPAIQPPTTVAMGAHCLMPRPSTVTAQEGNPGHKEPPPGWTCSQSKDTPKDHQCSCHRECKDREGLDEFGEGNGRKETYLAEDVKCRSFCFKDHCNCPVHNCD